MAVDKFESIKAEVVHQLGMLSPVLTYHHVGHTLDVLEQCERIAAEEKVSDKHDLYLLRVAALYHDTGFLRVYQKHEAMSCQIFFERAPAFGFSEKEKEIIAELIMVTKLPQEPKTLLQRIICDADLDYLGRNDFLPISLGLKKEFFAFGVIIEDQAWDDLQISFISSHHYHTESSRRLREPVKQENLAALKKAMKLG